MGDSSTKTTQPKENIIIISAGWDWSQVEQNLTWQIEWIELLNSASVKAQAGEKASTQAEMAIIWVSFVVVVYCPARLNSVHNSNLASAATAIASQGWG